VSKVRALPVQPFLASLNSGVLMAQSDVLRPYSPSSQPTIDGGDQKYLEQELRKISQAISLLSQVVKQIDARLIAHGF
jgi:hypothetical protein